MEMLSLSGQGIQQLGAGQLGLWVHASSSRLTAEPSCTTVDAPHDSDSHLPLSTSLPLPLGMQLRHLDLSHNVLDSVSGLEGLPQLQVLDLSYNRLSSLRNDVDALNSGLPLRLTHLNLSHNQLVSLGNVSTRSAVNHSSRGQGGCLQALQHLQVLDVSFNDLRDLRGLPGASLVELEAGHNALCALNGVEQCSALTVLCVTNNLFTTAESVASVKSLSQLRVLAMSGNPLLLRKRQVRSLQYLLPPALSHTDLPFDMSRPASAQHTALAAKAEANSPGVTQRPSSIQRRPSFSTTVEGAMVETWEETEPSRAVGAAALAPVISCWETVARILRDELAQTTEDRNRLARKVAQLEGQCASRGGTVARPPTPPPPQPARPVEALSIVAEEDHDDDKEDDRKGHFPFVDNDGQHRLYCGERTHVGPNTHPYDINQSIEDTGSSPEARRAPMASLATPNKQSATAHNRTSLTPYSAPKDAPREEGRMAAKNVMKKLRQSAAR